MPAQQIFLTTFDKIISVTTTYNIKEKVLAQKSNHEVSLSGSLAKAQRLISKVKKKY